MDQTHGDLQMKIKKGRQKTTMQKVNSRAATCNNKLWAPSDQVEKYKYECMCGKTPSSVFADVLKFSMRNHRTPKIRVQRKQACG